MTPLEALRRTMGSVTLLATDDDDDDDDDYFSTGLSWNAGG